MARISIYDYWPGIAGTRHNPRGSPCVVEIGVHHGDDSARLTVTSPTGSLDWIGFEPDPRNVEFLRERGIAVIDKAVSDEDGEADFWLSSGWSPGCEGTRWHTDSSSLNRPTSHLDVYPWCRFEEKVRVKTARLDTAMIARTVDLMWVDVQGAQRKVLAGAPETLQRTRYLYIECHPIPLYEGEPTFEELCGLLPDFAVVKRWPSDVLFRNKLLPQRWSRHFARVAALELAACLIRPTVHALRRARQATVRRHG